MSEEVAFDARGACRLRIDWRRFLDVLSHDIADAGSEVVVVVGDRLGADAVAAGIRLNQKLGSFGKLQSFTPLVDNDLGANRSRLDELVKKINRRRSRYAAGAWRQSRRHGPRRHRCRGRDRQG